MRSTQHLIQDFPDLRILVVGDVMLDRYWFGQVERISPEAPVPIAQIKQQQDRLGGAANVARNLTALGVQTSLLSVVGDDEAGHQIVQLTDHAGIENRVCQDPNARTTLKLRVLAQQQQLIRLDFEGQLGPELDELIHKQFSQLLPDHDAVIFSDYGKGNLQNCQALIQEAKALGKKTLADPKGADYTIYHGVDVMTPNRKELMEVTGPWYDEIELHHKAQKLREQLAAKAILVTRSEEGMSLFTEQESIHQSTRAREVYDVSGAGDTVIASFAAAWLASGDFTRAMLVANSAAGCVVAKLGTATCSASELYALLENEV